MVRIEATLISQKPTLEPSISLSSLNEFISLNNNLPDALLDNQPAYLSSSIGTFDASKVFNLYFLLNVKKNILIFLDF